MSTHLVPFDRDDLRMRMVLFSLQELFLVTMLDATKVVLQLIYTDV